MCCVAVLLRLMLFVLMLFDFVCYLVCFPLVVVCLFVCFLSCSVLCY